MLLTTLAPAHVRKLHAREQRMHISTLSICFVFKIIYIVPKQFEVKLQASLIQFNRYLIYVCCDIFLYIHVYTLYSFVTEPMHDQYTRFEVLD